MGQIDIPLKMPHYKNLNTAMEHSRIVKKLTTTREGIEELENDLRSIDKVDIDGTEPWTDVAPGKGHVIMVGEAEGGQYGYEMKYRPEDGSPISTTADTPDVKVTRSGGGTFKMEEGEGEKASTTYFKFDDNRGVVSILDPKNEVPTLFGDANISEMTQGVFQNMIPIIQF